MEKPLWPNARSRVAVIGLGASVPMPPRRWPVVEWAPFCWWIATGWPFNLNRQLLATTQTVGAAQNPSHGHSALPWWLPSPSGGSGAVCPAENVSELLEPAPDYILDAIDTVSAKLALAEECVERNIPSSAVWGQATNWIPPAFGSAIFTKRVCPLCRVMRRELRKREVSALKVVWSDEERSVHPMPALPKHPGRASGCAGQWLLCAPCGGADRSGEVLRDLMGKPVMQSDKRALNTAVLLTFHRIK